MIALLRVKGIAKIYLNGELFKEVHNAWNWYGDNGLRRVARIITGQNDSDAFRCTVHTLKYVTAGPSTVNMTTTAKTPSNNTLTISGNVVGAISQLTGFMIYGMYNSVEYPLARFNFSAVDIPSGWTVSVDWSIVFSSGFGIDSALLNTIPYALVNVTDNSTTGANSLALIYNGGTVVFPITQISYNIDNSTTYNNGTVTWLGEVTDSNVYNTISTLELRRNSTRYSYATITPFDKGSDQQLFVYLSTTISTS